MKSSDSPSHCHLFIPGLFPPCQRIDVGLLRDMRLPNLETLLVRGKAIRLPDNGTEAWLCRAFGVEKQRDWPVAALTLPASDGSPGDGFWLLAEPVHLQLQRDRLVLMAAGEISADEAASLTAALNGHFAAEGLSFFPSRPDRWHLRLARPARIETHPLETAIGRNIRNLLPAGPEGGEWHRILNEIQMLLHGHPVNEQREQRGALPVNSIWPWGGGVLPADLAAPFVHVWADDALARGLAAATGIPCANTPETAAEWLRHAAPPGDHLIVLDALRSTALHGDFQRWRESMLHLEENWFGPLRQALSHGEMTRLTLYIFDSGQARAFSVSRADLWKFWRRGRPLETFFGEPSS